MRATGSFAVFIRAPRIWCFFTMLRLRHDADFSEAMWDKGFRLVACDLDPTARAAAAAAGGAGGGGQAAANPFAQESPEELVAKVAKLVAEEGRKVDAEARAGAAEGVCVCGMGGGEGGREGGREGGGEREGCE